MNNFSFSLKTNRFNKLTIGSDDKKPYKKVLHLKKKKNFDRKNDRFHEL